VRAWELWTEEDWTARAAPDGDGTWHIPLAVPGDCEPIALKLTLA